MKEMSLRELQQFSLEILKDVHVFCEKNGINYSLYGGTLLGAIRHKGFIPWDDDIDIIMPRQDYDRFCATYKSECFRILNVNIDKTFTFAYSRVCDISKTKYITKTPCNKSGMGVWIDVFPADAFPANIEDIPSFYQKALDLEKKKNFYRFGLREYLSYSSISSVKDFYCYTKKNLTLFVLKSFLFIRGWKNPYVFKQIKLCHSYEFGSTPFWGALTAPYKHIVFHPIVDCSSYILLPFEDGYFYALNGYEGLLQRVYGDYMQLPPIEKRIPQLSSSYKFYWL